MGAEQLLVKDGRIQAQGRVLRIQAAQNAAAQQDRPGWRLRQKRVLRRRRDGKLQFAGKKGSQTSCAFRPHTEPELPFWPGAEGKLEFPHGLLRLPAVG